MEEQKIGFWDTWMVHFVQSIVFPLIIVVLTILESGTVYSFIKTYLMHASNYPEIAIHSANLIAYFTLPVLIFAFICFAIVDVSFNGVCPNKKIGFGIVSVVYIALGIAAFWFFSFILELLPLNGAIRNFISIQLCWFCVLDFVSGLGAIQRNSKRTTIQPALERNGAAESTVRHDVRRRRSTPLLTPEEICKWLFYVPKMDYGS